MREHFDDDRDWRRVLLIWSAAVWLTIGLAVGLVAWLVLGVLS